MIGERRGLSKIRARFGVHLVAACVALALAEAQAQEPPNLPPPRKAPEGGVPQWKPPEPDRVIRLETEETLHERMRREAKMGLIRGVKPYDATFPEQPVISKEAYVPRHWDPLAENVEPPYVCYGRLFFEQINSERYGWDLGIAHPLLSAGIFYFDVALLPYKLGTDPLRCYECNTGYCLPGDPVPLLLYPPQLSATGILVEAGTIAVLFAIFP